MNVNAEAQARWPTLQAVGRAPRWPRAPRSDIPEGWYVNLGIGIPTLVANHVPPEREVDLPFRERHPRHGPGAGAGQDQPLADQCQQAICHPACPAAPTCTTPTASR